MRAGAVHSLAEQTYRYAEELSSLYRRERLARERAEAAAQRLEASYDATVRALVAAFEMRDAQTGRHAERVACLAEDLTREAAPALEEESSLYYGFLLHDIGKIGIPDAILRKPGPLDDCELAVMRAHTQLGERIVDGIDFLDGPARSVIASHHERWDGSGYPCGLSSTAIPLPARIFALADAFDAMTHDRPYRTRLSSREAMQRIADDAGTHFDPQLAETFLTILAGER